MLSFGLGKPLGFSDSGAAASGNKILVNLSVPSQVAVNPPRRLSSPRDCVDYKPGAGNDIPCAEYAVYTGFITAFSRLGIQRKPKLIQFQTK